MKSSDGFNELLASLRFVTADMASLPAASIDRAHARELAIAIETLAAAHVQLLELVFPKGAVTAESTWGIVGDSKPMCELRSLLPRVGASQTSVLITGENGSGKEGVARALLKCSKRSDKPFLSVNCGAFQESLLESQLFGHVKGAFTGAIMAHEGFFSRADGGTLFLDEVGDTSPGMQVKLLRVLQEGTFLPVGGTREVKVDVRILAATNRDLKAMIKERSFREDLYFRLNVVNLHVPPLRHRKEDIPLLVRSFIEDFRAREGVPGPKSACLEVLELFAAHDWPGNVRELENAVRRLLVLSHDSPFLNSSGLPRLPHQQSSKHGLVDVDLSRGIETLNDEYERMLVEAALATHPSMSAAARTLRITQPGLRAKMDRLGLSLPARTKSA